MDTILTFSCIWLRVCIESYAKYEDLWMLCACRNLSVTAGPCWVQAESKGGGWFKSQNWEILREPREAHCCHADGNPVWTLSHLLESIKLLQPRKCLRHVRTSEFCCVPEHLSWNWRRFFPAPPLSPISCTQQSDFSDWNFFFSDLKAHMRPFEFIIQELVCIWGWIMFHLSFFSCTEQFWFLTEMPFSFWEFSEICLFKNLLHGMYLQFVNTACQRMIWFSGEAARYLHVMRSKGNKLTLSLPPSSQILMGPSNSSGKVFCFFWTWWMLVPVKTCNYFFLYFLAGVTKRSSLKLNVSIEAFFCFSFIC